MPQYVIRLILHSFVLSIPAIYLNSDTVEFAGEIKVEFGFNLYIFRLN